MKHQAGWAARCLMVAAFSLAPGLHAEPVVYQLDPAHSSVTFEVLHFNTSTIRGRFNGVAGEVVLDRAAQRGEVGLRIGTTAVDTGLLVFNARLREADILASEEYPEAFFVARNFRFEGDKLAEVRGEFSFRGRSQPLSLFSTRFVCRDDARLRREVCGGDFEAEFQRSSFGLNFGLPFIGDRIRLLVQVEGVRR
jgi:polyisoprenoid-binding protein YceI